MNERIKELMAQAVTRFDRDMDGSMEPEEFGQWVRVDDLGKFARLIVLECVECLKPLSRNHSMVGAAQDTIREHFNLE